MEQGSLRCDVNLSLAPERLGRARHPHRDQERELAALGRARRRATRSAGTPRSSAGGGSILQETRHWHEDTGVTTSGARSPTPRTTATSPSPTWCRWRRRASGSRSCGPRCPSRRASGARGCRQDWGFTDLEMRDTVGAGALGLVEETIAAGASPQAARKWWLGELARRANESEHRADRAAGHPGRRGPGAGAGRRGHDQRQARPPGPRRACSPARARPTRSSPPAGSPSSPTRAPSRAAVDTRDRREPRRRRQDPRRQGRRRRCADRRGDEGDARPGRRRPGPRADPREALLTGRERTTSAPTGRERTTRACRAVATYDGRRRPVTDVGSAELAANAGRVP